MKTERLTMFVHKLWRWVTKFLFCFHFKGSVNDPKSALTARVAQFFRYGTFYFLQFSQLSVANSLC